MNTPKKFRVWLPSLNKFGDDNSVFMNCYGKLYGVTRPSLVDDSRSIVNIGQFKEFDGYTIQWYTGLNDKNNIEVYEGDIVKINRCYIRPFINEKQQIDYKFIDDGEVEVGQVFWGWNTQKYLVSYEHIRYDDIEDFDKPSHRVEVIGNIFEHKHLLEK
jgi:uncharacterized phage protein (TIGR01671 family)